MKSAQERTVYVSGHCGAASVVWVRASPRLDLPGGTKQGLGA